jgi:hypothetical protein
MNDGAAQTAPTLPSLAQQINDETEAAESSARAAVQHALRAGELLARAKALIPHGQWEAWVTTNCTIAPRTAQAYVRLHEKLSALPDSEAQRVALLPLREAMRAIATPAKAPPRHSRRVQVRRDEQDRLQVALGGGADALRLVAKNVRGNVLRREQIAKARTKLRAALDALDRLDLGGDDVGTAAHLPHGEVLQ